jgi:hypothetical protein
MSRMPALPSRARQRSRHPTSCDAAGPRNRRLSRAASAVCPGETDRKINFYHDVNFRNNLVKMQLVAVNHPRISMIIDPWGFLGIRISDVRLFLLRDASLVIAVRMPKQPLADGNLENYYQNKFMHFSRYFPSKKNQLAIS